MSALRKVASLSRTGLFLPGVLLTVVAAVDAVAFWRSPAAFSLSRFVRSTGGVKAASAVPPAPRRKLASAAHQSVPRLEFSAERLDLGEGKPNQVLRGELTLTNRAATAAKFSLVKHCGCTELSPLFGELSPGGSQTIRVGVRLPDYANSEKSTSVEAQTANSATVVARCILTAQCPSPFHVAPAFISFGSLCVEDLPGTVVKLLVDSVGAKESSNVANLKFDHSNDAFAVKRAPSALGCSAILHVGLAIGLPAGEHRDTLNLRLEGSDYVMRVPLNVEVVEPISVVPRTVVLRKYARKASFRAVELLVMVRANHRLCGAISLAGDAQGVLVDDLGDVAPGRRRIRVKITSDAASLPDESTVWLTDGAAAHFGFKLVKPTSYGGER